ncbi:hypothetical protein JCM10449v2_003029 [Rhodotorula kratochvilovae]
MRRAAAGALRTALHSRSSTLPARPSTRPAPRPARPFSSSTPTPFFFRKPTKSSQELVRELLEARRDDRPDILAKLYPALVDAVQLSSSSSSKAPLSHGQFQDLMRFAASTGKFRLALRMFNDGATHFNFVPSITDHQILLQAMSRVGRMQKAVEWLESMRATHGVWPTVSEWNVVLQGYRRADDLAGMRALVERMRAHGVEPNVVSYNTFLAALFEQGDLRAVRALQDEMAERGVQPDLWTEQTLLAGFLDAGELASAREVQRRLLREVQAATGEKGKAPAVQVDTATINALVKFEAVEHGFDAGVRAAEMYRGQRVALNALTLNTLLQHGTAELRTAEEGIALLERLEDALGVAADRRAWSMVIAALAQREDGLAGALQTYQLARDRSVQPDSSMIQPLLSALLSPSPTRATLDTAKELYDDLATSSRSFSTAPDASIYVTLLRACADPRTPDLEWSRALLGDMKQRGVRLDGAAVAWHAAALMRAAPSFEDAFAAYDELRALDPSVLDRRAYNTLLGAFTSLAPPASGGEPAPAPLIMEFLADMRTSGHPPDSATYALLLTYYSRAASASPATIAHLHSLIKLDVHLDPDTALFNALMGAYSRTGASNAAYRIWDGMLLSAPGAGVGVDATSVSTLLDTAGHDALGDGERRARQVWADLAAGRIRVQRNRKNWDSWVEALCRWGRLAEAEEVVFEEMKPGKDVVAGDSTVRALLKFARRESVEAQERVARRIREERPDLWDAVEKLALRKRWSAEEEKAARAAAEGGEDAPGGFFSSTAAVQSEARN